MKRKVVYDPTLGFTWHFQIGGSEASAIRWFCNKIGAELPKEDPAQNAGSFIYNKQYPYFAAIWIDKKSGGGTCAHEVAHAVMHVCRVFEMDPREVDEFQASYHGYLYRQLTSLFYRR